MQYGEETHVACPRCGARMRCGEAVERGQWPWLLGIALLVGIVAYIALRATGTSYGGLGLVMIVAVGVISHAGRHRLVCPSRGHVEVVRDRDLTLAERDERYRELKRQTRGLGRAGLVMERLADHGDGASITPDEQARRPAGYYRDLAISVIWCMAVVIGLGVALGLGVGTGVVSEDMAAVLVIAAGPVGFAPVVLIMRKWNRRE